jgi:hypothetical protein
VHALTADGTTVNILLIFSKVHVRSRDPQRVYDRHVESGFAFLPPAHHASAVAKARMLRSGRLVWGLDGCSNGVDRNKMRQSYPMAAVRQDLS